MDLGGLIRDFLISLRFLGFFAAAPLFSNPVVPWVSRVGFSLILGLALGGMAAPHWALPANALAVGLLGGREAVVGLATGYFATLVFAIFSYAGGLMDMSLGLGMAQAIDPTSGQESALTGSLLTILAFLLFIGTGADRLLVLGFLTSYRWIPLGGGHLTAGTMTTIVQETGAIFADGLLVALPTLSLVLLAEIGLGLIGRLVPQFNVFMFALGLQPPLVLLALASSFTFLLLLMHYFFQGLEADFLVFLRTLASTTPP